MAALLKLNEAGRIQELIEQNMSLAKNLREANEKVDRLNRESNADKDAITDALRDLAIAKSQINRLHQEKREQDKRLDELENRLKNEESDLASGKIAADPAEVEVLRDIIKRQLRVQERRRQARDLLVEAAKELGAKDERLAKAIELFDAQEIALSPEEQKLIADRQVDGEFVSPFARDRATVGQATDELNRDIAVFERTAEKSFVAGRLLPTRELYQMILEQHPGHTPIALQARRRPPAARRARRRRGHLPPRRRTGFQQSLRLPHARILPDETRRPSRRRTSRPPLGGSRAQRCEEPDAAGHALLPPRSHRRGGVLLQGRDHRRSRCSASPITTSP